MTEFFDCPGPMAKSAGDLADLAEIMLGRPFTYATPFGWNGIAVGFVDPRIWKLHEEVCAQFEGTAEQMVSRLPQHHNSCLG